MTAALAQIGATALLLAAMRDRSFVVITAYAKTEAMQVAVFGLLFLGDRVTLNLAAAILVATIGVLLVSWPRNTGGEAFTWKPALLGIGSGAHVRHCRHRLSRRHSRPRTPSFVVGSNHHRSPSVSSSRLSCCRPTYSCSTATILFAIFRLWRPSLLAGFTGAFASQMWFLAFALETAAKVRTLALIEIPMAQVLSRNLFKQTLASREAFGIALIVGRVIPLLNT